MARVFVACWAAVPWPSRAIDAEEQKQVRRELAALFHQHYVVPGAGTTAREVRDMAAALRFIRSLRCGEASWCAKAAPLRSLRRSEEEEILQRLHASQNPANCEDARYLVFHDDRTTSGFGWNAFILFSAFLQAFLEERVLVEAAAVSDREHQRWRQRWCSDPPYSLKCFFRSWSKCERPDLVSKAVPMGLSSLLDWKNAESAGKTNTSCTCNEPSALWRASQRSDETFFPSMVAKGRFWWYAAMVRLLMEPLPWLQEAAKGFWERRLHQRPFVVAAVRRGNKSVEVPHVELQEFTNQLRAFKEHGIKDVLLQTEDPETLQLLERWCGYQGLRLHYTSNVRLGLDRFSTRFWQAEVNMTEEGRVAVLNLLLGSRAVAVLGSFHSAWMKLQPAFMMAYHWKAVLVIGLAGQDYQNFGSLDNPRQQLLRPGEVFDPSGL